MKHLLIALFSIALMPGVALASQTVTSPYVTEGQFGLELKGGYNFDDDKRQDDSSQVKTEAFYTPTDFMQVKIGANFQHRDGQDTETSSIHLETKFELATPGKYFVDPGLRLKYLLGTDTTPDEVEVKFLLAKQTGNIDHIANLIFSREVGGDANTDMNYGLSYSAAYKISDNLKLGAEWYSDFGTFEDDFEQQAHQLGPVAYGKLGGGFGYQAGVLFGVSDAAPDVLIKTIIDYKFKF